MYNSIIHYALYLCIPTLIRIWSGVSVAPSLNKSYNSVLIENKCNDLAVDPGAWGDPPGRVCAYLTRENGFL